MRGSPAERELRLRELDCEVLATVVGDDGQLAPSGTASGGGHFVLTYSPHNSSVPLGSSYYHGGELWRICS